MVATKKSKSTTLKSWDDCKHSEKGETRILLDHSDHTQWEVCTVCGLSRKVKWTGKARN